MFTSSSKLILVTLVIGSIILVLVNGKQDNSQQTCSKEDEICKNAAKDTEKADSTAQVSTGGGTAADTSSQSKTDKTSSKKTETKEKPKKTKSKNDEKELKDCPLCSYTRPLVKHILDFIKDLLTDPMLIMLFNMVKDKVWELGHMTKDLIGFRLF